MDAEHHDPSPEPPHRLAEWVHRTLVVGLALSAALLAIGLGVALLNGQGRSSGPPPPVAEIVRGAAKGQGAGLIDLGLLALMATPIARVAVLGLGWGLDRQWRFLAVALAVLALLAVGLLLGMG